MNPTPHPHLPSCARACCLVMFLLLPAAVQAQFTTSPDGNGDYIITGYSRQLPARFPFQRPSTT